MINSLAASHSHYQLFHVALAEIIGLILSVTGPFEDLISVMSQLKRNHRAFKANPPSTQSVLSALQELQEIHVLRNTLPAIYSGNIPPYDFAKLHNEVVTIETSISNLSKQLDDLQSRRNNPISQDVHAGTLQEMLSETCTLREIAHDPDVRRRFTGGIYLMSLGKDATVGTVIEQLCLIEQASGGAKKAAELRREISLEVVFTEVYVRFAKHCCLFIIDDVWGSNDISSSVLDQLSQLVNGQG